MYVLFREKEYQMNQNYDELLKTMTQNLFLKKRGSKSRGNMCCSNYDNICFQDGYMG